MSTFGGQYGRRTGRKRRYEIGIGVFEWNLQVEWKDDTEGLNKLNVENKMERSGGRMGGDRGNGTELRG